MNNPELTPPPQQLDHLRNPRLKAVHPRALTRPEPESPRRTDLLEARKSVLVAQQRV